jgi:hypothetical protein
VALCISGASFPHSVSLVLSAWPRLDTIIQGEYDKDLYLDSKERSTETGRGRTVTESDNYECRGETSGDFT